MFSVCVTNVVNNYRDPKKKFKETTKQGKEKKKAYQRMSIRAKKKMTVINTMSKANLRR